MTWELRSGKLVIRCICSCLILAHRAEANGGLGAEHLAVVVVLSSENLVFRPLGIHGWYRSGFHNPRQRSHDAGTF